MIVRSLHARFLWAVTLAVCLMGAIASLMVYRMAHSHVQATGLATIESMIGAIEKTAAAGAYAHDPELVREIADGLVRHPLVSAVRVNGVRDGRSALLRQQADSGSDALEPASGGAPAFEQELHSPFDRSEVVGQLQVWVDQEQLGAQARRQAMLLGGALLTLLVGVMLVINSLAMRLLSRPMYRLAKRLASMQPGTSDRVPVEAAHAHDEVGTVTAAANRLLELQHQALERERLMRSEIAQMEAHYRGIFDSTSAGLFVLSPRLDLLHGNPALGRLLGVANGALPPELHGRFIDTSLNEPARMRELIASARASGQPEAADLEMRRLDGSLVWVHCLVSVLLDEHTMNEHIEGVLYDITQRKLAERLAQHRAEHDTLTGLKSRSYVEASLEQRVKAASLRSTLVTLLFIDLDGFKSVNDRWGHATGDAVLIEAAHRLRAIFQRNADVVGRLGGDELVVILEGLEADDDIVRDLAQQLIRSFATPFQLPHGEEARIGASVGAASYPRHATTAATLLIAADAAMYAVKQAGKGDFVIANGTPGSVPTPAPLAPAAAPPPGSMHDPLTGLPDRRLLADRMNVAMARVRRSGQMGAVICMDIEQFKTVNVARGHKAGDELLCEIARRLPAVLRGEDTAARTGSDEFVIVVSSCGGDREAAIASALAVTRKLIDVVARPAQLSDGPLSVRACAGLSLLQPDTAHPQDALREAQLALRRSKARGGGSIEVFQSDMMEVLHDRLAMENDLRTAIGSEQFQLHVQPQIDVHGRLCGGEALLRWQHPQRGNVPPDQFIPLAESTGSIVELGRWVLQEGCRILARMDRAGQPLALSINISPIQFQHEDFLTHVHEALGASGAPPDQLVLEITESLLISQVDEVVRRMRSLAALGVRFSIDDFGTGFSSLSYLRHLPLYEIKIDRSFVAGLIEDTASTGIVQSILAMGSHLGLHVVAEGVETQAQSDFLSGLRCDSQQGWLHGRPMQVEAWFERLRAAGSDAPIGSALEASRPEPAPTSQPGAAGSGSTGPAPVEPEPLVDTVL